MFLIHKPKTDDSKRKSQISEYTFILAYVEQFKNLPKLHYGSASGLIAFRILKMNALYMDVGLTGVKD